MIFLSYNMRTTLIFMEGDINQILALKNLLHKFSCSTCLKINFAKSMIVPINMEQGDADQIATALGCSVGTLPFTYLGLPLHNLSQVSRIFGPLSLNVKIDLYVLPSSSL
jgi:hypothetical protein